MGAKKTSLHFALYTGAVTALTLALSAAVLLLAWDKGLSGWPRFAAFGLPLLFISSQAALSLVNWFFTKTIEPRKLPRLDFSQGIPAHAHTLTVIPTMLTSAGGVDSLLENIEVCYLANIDANVGFALLTDLCDAAAETLPGDAALLEQAGKA